MIENRNSDARVGGHVNTLHNENSTGGIEVVCEDVDEDILTRGNERNIRNGNRWKA